MGSRIANNVDLILLQCVSFLFLWATDCRWTVTGSEKWFVYFRGRLTHPVLVAAITYAISSNRKQLLKYYRQPAALNCRTPPSVRCWLCVCHQQNKQLNTVYMWLRRWGFGGGGVWSRVLTAAPRTPWPESGNWLWISWNKVVADVSAFDCMGISFLTGNVSHCEKTEDFQQNHPF